MTLAAFIQDQTPEIAFALCFVAFNVFMGVMGFGAAALLLPRRLQRYSLLLAAPLGFCVSAFLCWHLMAWDRPGTDSYWRWVLAAGMTWTVAACALRAFAKEKEPVFQREVALLALVALLAAVGPALPIRGLPRLTSVSFGNNDVASYAVVERYLQDSRLSDRTGGFVGLKHAKGHARHSVTGTYHATSLLSSALGVPTFRLQVVCIASYCFWIALCCGVFLRHVLRFRLVPALLVNAIGSLSPLPLFLAFQNFKAQLAAMALYLAMMSVTIPVLTGAAEESPFATLPSAILLFFGISLGYPHMLPLVAATLVPVAVLAAIETRSRRPLLVGGRLLVAVGIGLALLSPYRMKNALLYLSSMGGITAGYFLPWTTPHTFLGLSGEGLFFSDPAARSLPIVSLSSILLAALWIWGFGRAYFDDRRVFVACVSLLLTIGSAYLVLIVQGRSPIGLGGYKAFKLLSFFAPALLCASLVSLRDTGLSWRSWPDAVRVVVMLLLLVLGATTASSNVETMFRQRKVVSEDLAALQQLEKAEDVASLNLNTDDYWESMWQTAFLFHKRLFIAQPTYYPASTVLAGDWTLVRNRQDEDHIVNSFAPDASSVRPVNATYSLVHRGPPVAFGMGWHPSEQTHRWTSAKRSRLIVRSAEVRRARLELRYRPLDPGNEFTIELNGTRVGACAKDPCVVDALDFQVGVNVLDLVSKLSPRPPDGNDQRNLGFAVYSVLLLPQ